MRGKRVLVMMLVTFLSLNTQGGWKLVQRTEAAGPSMNEVAAMIANNQEQAALEIVIRTAREVGGWGPAPGDDVVFDPYMSRQVRGAVWDFDEMPDCHDPKVSPDPQACLAQFVALERQVRFGPSLFTTPQADGSVAPRPIFDDLLSTYIEEVGHSWQEYQYEMQGSGSGLRQRPTTLAESQRWAAGREYQIKRYILSLDGDLLALSEEQRGALMAAICDGYANPLGHEVPVFGAPAGWPKPAGWLVANPTADELGAFCAGA